LIPAVSAVDSKRGEISLLPNTQTTHNRTAACGRKDKTKTAQKHIRHNDISLIGQKRKSFTINSTIVQKRGVILQLKTLLTDPVVNNLSLRDSEDVKNFLQNSGNREFIF
jgi:hypothetical protein